MWQEEQAAKCPGCGFRTDETTYDENDPPDDAPTFTAHLVACHACAVRDRKAESNNAGHYVVVTKD